MLNHLPDHLVLYILYFLDYEHQILATLCSKRYYQWMREELRQIYLPPAAFNNLDRIKALLAHCKHPSRQLICVAPQEIPLDFNISIPAVKRLLCRYQAFHSIFSPDKILFRCVKSLLLFRPYAPETFNSSRLETIHEEICSDFRQFQEHLQLIELILQDIPISLDSFPFPRTLQRLEFQRARISSLNPKQLFAQLQKLVFASCPELRDVSMCGDIPFLSISDCSNIMDISHLNNNVTVEIIRCHKVYDFSKSFRNSVQISIVLMIPTNSTEAFQFNFSHWHRVVALSLEGLSAFGATQFESDHPLVPATVKRCRLSLKFVEVVNWKSRCFQFTQLSLAGTSMSSLEGLHLDRVPIVILDSIQGLTSLRGLGGRNDRVEIRYCEQLQDFSAIGNVPVVSITTRAPFLSIHQFSSVREFSINADSIRLERSQNYSQIQQLDFRGLKRVPSFDGLQTIPRLIFRTTALYLFRDYLQSGKPVLHECITIDASSTDQILIPNHVSSLYEQYLKSSYSFHVVRIPSNALNSSYSHRYILIRKW